MMADVELLVGIVIIWAPKMRKGSKVLRDICDVVTSILRRGKRGIFFRSHILDLVSM